MQIDERRFGRGWCALLIALLLAHAGIARAQDAGVAQDVEGGVTEEEEEPQPAEAEAQAAAVPAEEIAAEAAPDPVEAAREVLRGAHLGELASRTRAALQRARPLLRSNDEISDIERRLPRAEADIDRLGHPTRLARIPQLSQRELVDLRQEWRRHGTTFEEWQRQLVERAATVEEARGELVELRRTWATLRRASEAAGRPEGRHERIVESLEQSRNAATELDRQRERVLALEDRVSELSIVVEEVMEQLRAATAAYRDSLLVRDHPPLWVAVAAPSDDPSSSLVAQARASFAQRTETPEELMSALLPGILRQLFLFAVLSGVVLVLGRRKEGWPEDDDMLAVARSVTSRPFATAALITLLSTPFLVLHAPILVYDVVFFLSLVPLARVLGPLAPPHVRALLYFVIALLCVNRIESMASEGTALLRIVLLLETSIGVAYLVHWVRRESGRGDRLTVLVRGIVIAGAIVLGGALVANVLGYLFLSTMLVRGTGFSVSTGLDALAAVLVAQSLLDLLLRSEGGRKLRTVRDHGPLIHRRVLRVLVVIAGLVWLAATLEGYALANPISKWFEETLAREWEIGSFGFSLGALFAALAILAATVVLARFIRFVLELDVLPRMKLEPGVDGAISGLTRYVIIGAGILLALAALGIDAQQIALVAGALGVGIGFGLQGIVANFIAGIVLMIERPVRLGDFIQVGPLTGSVERIGLRSSTVRAGDGSEVIVPNESLISREVVNWTLSDRKRRVDVVVGVAYGTDPKRVLEIMQSVASSHAGVLGETPPSVSFSAFGDSALTFTLSFWTTEFSEAGRLKSEVGIAVHDALTAAGIEMPFPQRDIHVRSLPEGLVLGPQASVATEPKR